MKNCKTLLQIVTIISLVFFLTRFAEAQNLPEVGIFDPDSPPEADIFILPNLRFGSEIEIEYELEKNFDLNDTPEDDLSILEPELQISLLYEPNDKLEVFLAAEFLGEFGIGGIEDGESEYRLGIEQIYLNFKKIFDRDLSLRVGRQRFRDAREWLWDAELDGIRAKYEYSDLSLKLSVSRQDLFDLDAIRNIDRDKIYNYVVYADYEFENEIDLAGYTIFRDDRTDNDDLLLVGIHSDGDISKKLEYWLEAAHSTRKNDSSWDNGIGLDTGLIFDPRLRFRPSLTVAYAFATKDFRQTGLEDNRDRFNGVAKFKYYGELIDPELSNLSIFTIGFGTRPTRKTSIDLVYHYYLLTDTSRPIRRESIDEEIDGSSKDVGSEIDLILGFEEFEFLEFRFILGYFIPGSAFSQNDNAFFLGLGIELEI